MSKYGYDFDLFGNPEDADEQSDASISNAPISDAPINKDMTSEVSASTVAGDFSAKYSNSVQSSQTAQSSAAAQYAQTSAQSSNIPEINPQSLLEGLNPQQSKAVQYTGPALLIGAGAGSGKTRVLTRRIAWILANRKAWPSQILAITFTNKAAAEMRERLASLIGNSANSMWVSTFHSACVKILRAHGDSIGLKSGFSIYDSSDCERLVKIIASELNIDIKKFTPKLLLSKISDFKNNLVTWQENLKNYAPDYKPGASVSGASSFNAAGNADALYAAVYAEYQNRLSVSNAVDFDDLIMLTVKLLRQNPQVSAYYKRKFRYILVDEYQDTNHAQYVLIRELAGVDDAGVDDYSTDSTVSSVSPDSTQLPQSSITVVGDSDQSIYAFRGADIRNIQDFEQDFPSATTIMLEQNYRSTQTILDAANAVISNNANRKPKKLWTSLGKGSPIVGYVADNAQGEASWVAQEIARLAGEDGVNYSDIAIMYRANSQSRSLEDALIKSGLPYQLVGGTKFYERREVKDALAYLQSIANPDDDVNMRRILNVPKRGLGARAESQITSYAKENSISFWSALSQIDKIAEQIGISSRTFNALKSFRDLMTSLIDFMKANDSKPSKVVENVLNESGLLQDLRESKDPQDEFRVDNLSQLQSVAAEYEQNTPDANVAGFLETTALVADSDQLPDQGEDTGKVTLMTLHTAKGLEYPVVFLTGMEQGTFPHSRCVDNQKELCEERRLAYVGITRAKKILYVTWAAERSQWGKSAEMIQSQFLDEIPADLISWKRKEADVMRAGLRGAGSDVDRDFDSDFGSDGGWDDDSYTTYGGSSYRKSHYGKSYASKSYGSNSYGSSYGKSYGSKSGKVTTRIARKSSASYQHQSFTSNLQSSSSSLSYKKQGLQEKDNHLNINDFHEGDKISHDTYGLGTVLKTQDKGRNSIITVDFGSDGVKRLMLRVAPIEKL
ncbi:ATP-dependent helicase [Gardnerella vaginalis]|uniref:ATP-dependent helicase n=1 Tax=Gardnerella vaginalis TaxID=2702 RepID=UPI0001E8E971|nr:UvrD-helicase domain-containing protein [Gardnerella vaginalis]KOS09621.1 ATP-dependent DNA helicase PcrA [Gardnerella vaginalis]BAQ33557.1 ATP-dependent DNA helicase PcrA [Gardnerella vaginalis ATCC 14018 = JCM 11026]SDR73951.1 DNA helicase-2 / ATP-dependent DNA helicase PcrA [Gardnerella vaginalis]VEH17619.1 ATP-dependent DNA helicase pcrA [Gardnerella vaginalis]